MLFYSLCVIFFVSLIENTWGRGMFSWWCECSHSNRAMWLSSRWVVVKTTCFVFSDQAGPAWGGFSPGLAHLSIWGAEDPGSLAPQPPRSVHSHQHSPPLLPSPPKVDECTVSHDSQSHACPSSHQHQTKPQHFPAVVTSAARRGHAEKHGPAQHHS